MTKNDLIYLVNNSSLKDFVPISIVASEKELKKYKEKGYASAYTCEEFLKKFPFLDISKLYYTKDCTNAVYYYDREKVILFSLNLFFSTDEQLRTILPDLENMYGEVLESFEKQYTNGKFFFLYSSNSSRLNMELFAETMYQIPKESIYDIFIDIYTTNDYGFDSFSKEDISYICECKSEESKLKTKAHLDLLVSGDEITIYRGEGDKSIDYKDAYSWTLDINSAYFFACRRGVSARIIEAKVLKKDVIEYINDRKEQEILVTSNNIYSVKSNELFASTDVLEYFPFVETYKKYREILRAYSCNLSDEHSKIHMLRVLLLALVIVSESYEVSLEKSEIETLCTACIFHDIGRTNDETDDTHGQKSYKKWSNAFNKKDTKIKFLIENHCIDDDKARAVLDKSTGLDEVEKDNLWMSYKILKDADALDRVRFNLRALDVSQLRISISEQLVLVAVECLSGLEL